MQHLFSHVVLNWNTISLNSKNPLKLLTFHSIISVCFDPIYPEYPLMRIFVDGCQYRLANPLLRFIHVLCRIKNKIFCFFSLMRLINVLLFILIAPCPWLRWFIKFENLLSYLKLIFS